MFHCLFCKISPSSIWERMGKRSGDNLGMCSFYAISCLRFSHFLFFCYKTKMVENIISVKDFWKLFCYSPVMRFSNAKYTYTYVRLKACTHFTQFVGSKKFSYLLGLWWKFCIYLAHLKIARISFFNHIHT